MDKQQVLIVEDEPLVQDLLQDVLEEAGFEVTASAGADEAVEQLQHPDRVYVALVTDVHLSHPNLTGWDIARRARELNPTLPVVYTTGAAAADWPSNGVPNSILVTKPFAPMQIVTAVTQLLNASSASAAATPPE